MADLLSLSARIIDEGRSDIPVNRITGELSELADDLSIVESFSHVVTLATAEGLVLFDTSGKFTGEQVRDAVLGWRDRPLHTMVYTHGHIDHVGGAGAFLAGARERGQALPRVVGHENVAKRFARYRRTNGYNLHVNRRQFSLALSEMPAEFLPADSPEPDVTFRQELVLEVGGERIELTHHRGETDDHTWAWIPARRTIMAGDFFIWNFPNAGNPQKVQRYPEEWAAALRAMASRQAELLVPAHGLPIAGRERIVTALEDAASALEGLVRDTLAMMNEGHSLDVIVREVKVPAELLAKPYLVPRYDEPEFVVRNVWRMYGGWYDGNPSRLKPPPDDALAREVAALAGGAEALASRAEALAAAGDLRLACSLVELAARAAPDSKVAHGARAEIYRARRKAETSLMAKGIYGTAARESWAVAHPDEPYPGTRSGGLNI